MRGPHDNPYERDRGLAATIPETSLTARPPVDAQCPNTAVNAKTLRRPLTIVAPWRLAHAFTSPAVVMALWAAVLMTMLSICVRLPGKAARWDFSIYYMSAKVLHEGGNPYSTDFNPIGKKLGLEVGDIHHATDPPTFLLLMEPFALTSERTGYYIWIGLNAIFLAASLMLLLRRPEFPPATLITLSALALMYPPLTEHFLAAQSKIPILLALVLMIRLMECGWDRTAGLCLAFACLIRVFPLLLLGYLVIQRRWRVLTWTVAGLLVGALLTVWMLGVDVTLSFRNGITLLTGKRWLGVPANIALAAAVSRLFWAFGLSSAGAEAMRRAAAASADLILLGATIGATLRLEPRSDPDWRGLGVWLVASVLLCPTAWVYYMVLFLIPFAQLAAAAHRSRVSERALEMAILSYVVIALTNIPLLPAAAIVLAYFGPKWTLWFMSVLIEGWFVSALLAYLAVFWFTVDEAG
jgi:hypothetical protein